MSKPGKAVRRKIEVVDGAENGRQRLHILLAFLSGSAALVYQVLWVKQLSLVVGAEIYAVTMGISAFFAGLAFGSALLGTVADRFTRPLRLYSLLEVGVAVSGIGVTLLLTHAGFPFVAMQGRFGPFTWFFLFALVGLPAVFMGGTLPALARSWAPREANVARRGGLLYSANTAGGIAGALLAPFALVPSFGLRGTAIAGGFISLCTSGLALASPQAELQPEVGERPIPTQRVTGHARAALALYAMAGGVALGYEVIWSQAIVPFMSTRSFAFAIVLATYLTGLGVGSAVCSRVADRIKDPWGTFGLLISVAGLFSLLQVLALGGWLLVLQTQAEVFAVSITGSHLAGMCARFAVAAACVVLIPTLFLGAAFPVVLRIATDARRVGRDVGEVIALNTVGGIAGTLLTGFVIVPVVGLVRALGTLAVTAAAIGMFAVFLGPSKRPGLRVLVPVMGFLVIVCGVVSSPDHIAKTLAVARGGGKLLFYQEQAAGTVAVLEERREHDAFRRLYIQGVSNSGDAMPSLRYMRLQALLPLIIHNGEPQSALVIGLGTGITAGALLPFRGLTKRVCVELLPGVVRASSYFEGNFRAGSDPRLEIRKGDGRWELMRSAESYDLITLEPPPPSEAGVANLYSSDFYVLAAKRLRKDGLLAQWLPLPAQNDEESRSLVRSFIDVFPYASLWSTELHEMLLVGSFEPIELDQERISERFSQPEVAAALHEVGVNSPAALLATWITDRDGLERFARDAKPVTDDRPRIEYATWVRPGEVARVLPELLALHTDPPIRGEDSILRASIAEEREHLLDFYDAGLAAYRGNRELWAQAVERVLRTDRGNPYFRWTLGTRP
jgi:spermidine synthase